MKIETDTLCGLFVGWVGFVYLKFFCRFDLWISNLLKTAKIQRVVNRYSEKKNHASSGQLL